MKKCPNCKGEKILVSRLESTGGFVFIPEGENRIFKKSSYVSACACQECGKVFDLFLEDKPRKLTVE